MRSDWDPDHNKKPDMQKRYPDITRAEWLTLRILVERALTTEEQALPQTALRQREAHYLGELFDKIHARLGEKERDR